MTVEGAECGINQTRLDDIGFLDETIAVKNSMLLLEEFDAGGDVESDAPHQEEAELGAKAELRRVLFPLTELQPLSAVPKVRPLSSLNLKPFCLKT